jgi:hypothetical protein
MRSRRPGLAPYLRVLSSTTRPELLSTSLSTHPFRVQMAHVRAAQRALIEIRASASRRLDAQARSAETGPNTMELLRRELVTAGSSRLAQWLGLEDANALALDAVADAIGLLRPLLLRPDVRRWVEDRARRPEGTPDLQRRVEVFRDASVEFDAQVIRARAELLTLRVGRAVTMQALTALKTRAVREGAQQLVALGLDSPMATDAAEEAFLHALAWARDNLVLEPRAQRWIQRACDDFEQAVGSAQT